MNDYITVLTRQLRHIVAKDLSEILHTKITQDIQLSSIYKNEQYREYEGASNED